MKLYLRSYILIFASLILCTNCAESPSEVDVIIPKPLKTKSLKGHFSFNPETKIYTNLEGEEKGKMLEYVKSSILQLSAGGKAKDDNTLKLIISEPDIETTSPEAYKLNISSSGITIEASNGAGLFYGIQSLIQLKEYYTSGELPCLEIEDAPQFPYRGLMLDVSRHFFSKEFVKKQLDMMAYYKLNRLHWHLTDAAGWRIEIKKYPQLTKTAAWRPQDNYATWLDSGKRYTTKDRPGAYGGYYTQEEIKEVVEYAESLHITVIPEIEMPGHSEEVLAVFPQLSCAGKPYANSDFCIGNDESFTFLENVLSEVIELFPSEYIHIGGDEAEKTGWKTCPKCKKRMAQENLKDVDELQSYMIHRIEKFLNSHNRQIIGWDEILDGGLAPNAVVMSWRGEQGGIAAARAKHHVIMTPNSHFYFDSYQDAPTTQPEAMSGFLPLDKVYSYNPLSDSLTAEQQKYILGVQGNVWAERIMTPEHKEYMIYPRLLALAEVGWTKEENKSLTSFRKRAVNAVRLLQEKGYHPFDINNEVGARPESRDITIHLARNKSVQYKTMYHTKYTAAGDITLTDGLLGGWSYSDKRWQGFLDSDIDITIDLEKITLIQSIDATFMQDYLGWIWMPKEVKIYVSKDNKDYSLLTTVQNTLSTEERGFFLKDFGWKGDAEARYIRYVAKASGKEGGWLFTDEIIVK